MKYLAKFRQGHGTMAQNAIDYYKDEDGKIVKHCWAMGGDDKTLVSIVYRQGQ